MELRKLHWKLTRKSSSSLSIRAPHTRIGIDITHHVTCSHSEHNQSIAVVFHPQSINNSSSSSKSMTSRQRWSSGKWPKSLQYLTSTDHFYIWYVHNYTKYHWKSYINSIICFAQCQHRTIFDSNTEEWKRLMNILWKLFGINVHFIGREKAFSRFQWAIACWFTNYIDNNSEEY